VGEGKGRMGVGVGWGLGRVIIRIWAEGRYGNNIYNFSNLNFVTRKTKKLKQGKQIQDNGGV
jgi:hypothetical protein